MVKNQSQKKLKFIFKRILAAGIFLACCQFLFSATTTFDARQIKSAQLNSIGIEKARSNDLIGAIRIWRSAIEYNPQNVHLYNNIGSALQRLGQDRLAFKWYEASIKIQPTYWTYYNISLLYGRFGQKKDQIWALKKSLQLKPDFEIGLRALSERSRSVKREELVFKSPIKIPTPSDSSPYIERQMFPQDNKKIVKKIVQDKKKIKSIEVLPKINTEKSKPGSTFFKKSGQVFLTFDGGAEDGGFESIVKTLSEFGVKSTFFLTGKFVENYPEKAKRLLLLGHEIANHSMNHKDMKNWSKQKIAAEIEAAENVFKKVLGQKGAPFFRFPFGHQNLKVEQFAEELGYRPVYWNIDTIDWREDSVEKIISRVSTKLKSGSVILMHVGSKNGANALPRILGIIRERGYSPVRLSDLNLEQIAKLP